MTCERTAIGRRSLSAPSRYLLEQGLLVGRILDFGCGRGDLVKFLDGDIEQYDPHFHPKRPRGKFDVVVCNYVLNVVSPRNRKAVLEEALGHATKKGGRLYVAVRRDIKQEGWTSIGTQQYSVVLNHKSLYRCSGFEIYEVTA